MTKVHNKKRNVGIIYDQIISTLCECHLNNDSESVEKISKIMTENFKKGSQLQKELQFFSSFLKMSNLNDSLSSSIINEAKKACKSHFSQEELDMEKSKLIKDLNYAFGKGKIFEKKVDNYKLYATIQTLLNEWRNEDNSDFSTISEYEIKLNDWLTRDSNTKEELNESKFKGIDNLTLKIMNDKFNKKYSNILNEDQKNLIKEYFASEDNSSIIKAFSNIKNKTILNLNSFKTSNTNTYLKESYNVVLNNIQNLDESDLSEENLKKFLTVAKLNDELKGN